MILSKIFSRHFNWAKHHNRIYKLYKDGYGLSLGDWADPRMRKAMDKVDDKYNMAIYAFLRDVYDALNTDALLNVDYKPYFGMITYVEIAGAKFKSDRLRIQLADSNESEGYIEVSTPVHILMDIDYQQPAGEQFIYKCLCRGEGRWESPDKYQDEAPHNAIFKDNGLSEYIVKDQM